MSGGLDSTTEACRGTTGWVANDEDCDDSDATLNPDTVWHLDYDGDGYGHPSFTLTQCEQPSSYVRDGSDCEDTEASASPAGTEVCDEIDNDCDGSVDEDLGSTWWEDADRDGYGTDDSSTTACEEPEGWSSEGGDCDDDDTRYYPGAPGTCEGLDNDCDGAVSEDEEVAGDSEECPSTSCLDLFDARSGLSDGYYWIDPAGTGSVEVWCDMSGGGWTLVYLATNSGGVAENGTVTTSGTIGTSPFGPTDSGHFKVDDTVINALRSGSVENDLMVVVEYDGAELGRSWHPSTCTLQSGTLLAATDGCNQSTRTCADCTDWTQSGHWGSLSRWYVDGTFGYIWPYTHIGPVTGGTGHGGNLPDPYCTWYDTRTCPAAGVFQIWAY